MTEENTEEATQLPEELSIFRDEMVKLVGLFESAAFMSTDAFARLTETVISLQYQVFSLKIQVEVLKEEKND